MVNTNLNIYKFRYVGYQIVLFIVSKVYRYEHWKSLSKKLIRYFTFYSTNKRRLYFVNLKFQTNVVRAIVASVSSTVIRTFYKRRPLLILVNFN